MSDSSPRPPAIRFGVFEVDLRAGELRRNGSKVKLQEQPFQILAMLLERPGELVTREEIQKRLWSEDTFVDFEHSLATAIKKLREALGDSADNPRFVETLPRRGYRFIAAVEPVSPPAMDVGATRGVAQGEAAPRSSKVLALAGAVVIAGAVLTYWLTRPLPPPRVTGTALITTTRGGGVFSPLLSDGTRIYFSDSSGDHWVIKQTSIAGGEAVPVPMPFRSAYANDISPERSELLVADWSTVGWSPLWILPVVGRSPRRVGEVMASEAAWSPDKQRILYVHGSDFYITNNDGRETRKVLTYTGGRVWRPQWSPDGRIVRFSLIVDLTGASSIWEFSVDGSNLHPLHPEWLKEGVEFTGGWTPDGKYYIFQAFLARTGRPDLYAIREKGGPLGRSGNEPIQLTAGPGWYGPPLVAMDGKKLFAGCETARAELMRYDLKSRQFVPYLPGISPQVVDFSGDGEWVAYASQPEGFLWRSKPDGSEPRQLTFTYLQFGFLRWSPDGKRIAYVAGVPGKPSKIYLVPAEGGTAQEVIHEDGAQVDPQWSPDGNVLLFGRSSVPLALHLIDLRTRQIFTLPNSEGLEFPRWSPDGRYIVASEDQGRKLVLYEYSSHKRMQLAESEHHFFYWNWSRDGKFLYVLGDVTGKGYAVLRYRLNDRKWEQVISPEERTKLVGSEAGWLGLTPDDSPLLVRDTSSGGIYALDWEAP